MNHRFYLCAAGHHAGLTSVSLGMARALDRQGVRVAFCKPISQRGKEVQAMDPSIIFADRLFGVSPPEPIPIGEAENYLREGRLEDLMERVVELVDSLSDKADVVVVEGLLAEEGQSFKNRLNREMVKALGAEMFFVGKHTIGHHRAFIERIEVTATTFGGTQDPSVVGCIANRVSFPGTEGERTEEGIEVGADGSAGDGKPDGRNLQAVLSEERERLRGEISRSSKGDFLLFGCIPDNPALRAVRSSDVAAELKAELLHAGEMNTRRVRSVALCARNVPNMLHVLQPGALIITPGDRNDVIMAVALASLNKVPLAGLVLTGTMKIDERILELCRNGLETTGLPVFRTRRDSFRTASQLAQMSEEVPPDDFGRIEQIVDFVARNLDGDWIRERIAAEVRPRVSPAAFRHMLARKARSLGKTIVLPEGTEPRTIIAAAACAERGIAKSWLIGDPGEVGRVAAANGVSLPEAVRIVDPMAVRDRYLEPLLERRRHKGLSEERAREALEDTVVLGTMMLALGEVDGLVSGAVHSSANTVRPALQLIKTKEDARVVSSVFFMCLPSEVLVYGDCAINPDPDAKALADIAIQSAETARQFGIDPRIALISYSTGDSGSGADVDKVREATRLAQQLRPDLLIDGPLQYDAAATPDVAEKKAPHSTVAGRATVFVFPDLNTGNTTYKAVQRSANLISIGPVLQGLRKPVNDLSRGALVDDIIYTIAVTAIQAAG